jgi:cell division protein FtsB
LNLAKFKRHYDVKSYVFSAFLMVCFFYGFYQLFADRGVFTLYKVRQELEQQKQENDLLKKRQEYLESRVSKLEEDNKDFDYDYLDEVVREKLGVIKDSEQVIYIERIKQ